MTLRNAVALGSLGSALILIVAVGCAKHGPEVHTLGFLDGYEQLSAGREGQASLVFIDGEVDFSSYSAIVIDPVAARSLGEGAPSDATQDLTERFDAALRRELGREFELVDSPQPGALRMRSALASEGAGDDVHLVLEVELLDSETGARVVAVVDDRRLDDSPGRGDSRDTADFESIAGETVLGRPAAQIDSWAILTRDRLATFRQFDAAWRAREAAENR